MLFQSRRGDTKHIRCPSVEITGPISRALQILQGIKWTRKLGFCILQITKKNYITEKSNDMMLYIESKKPELEGGNTFLNIHTQS